MSRIMQFCFVLTLALLTACSGTDKETAETRDATETAAIAEGSTVYKINVDESKIHWEGYKLTSKHTGTIGVADGQLFVQDGALAGGVATIDMQSIEVTDLEGNSKAKLERHLKGTTSGKETDFFNVQEYPTARFEITKVTALENNADANAMIYGNLTMLDITKNIAFHSDISVTDDIVKATTPMFTIDRTEWGIKHRSGTFFPDIGDRLIQDGMGLQIDLVAYPGAQSNLQ